MSLQKSSLYLYILDAKRAEELSYMTYGAPKEEVEAEIFGRFGVGK